MTKKSAFIKRIYHGWKEIGFHDGRHKKFQDQFLKDLGLRRRKLWPKKKS